MKKSLIYCKVGQLTRKDAFMIKISKKIEYALMALKHISQGQKGEQFCARKICEIYKIPFDTTSKMMQIMNSHEILQSSQGVKGGYKLNKKLSEITFLQLCEMIEGTPYLTSCETPDGKLCSLLQTCNIVHPVKQLNQRLMEFLGELTLENILKTKPNFNLDGSSENHENSRSA